MQARYVMLASALAAALLGVGLSWADFGRNPPLEDLERLQSRALERMAQVVVDQRQHDFGTVEQNTTVKHAFRLTNTGKALLKLQSGPTSCSACTIAELSQTEVQPGESADVVVAYTASDRKAEFRQVAIVLTNDPRHSRVELAIVGSIAAGYNLVPSQLVLSDVPSSTPYQARVKLLSYRDGGVEIEKTEIAEPATAAFFEVASEPLPPDELGDAAAKSGLGLVVTVKPGLPLGPFRQTIRLTLAGPAGAEPITLVLPIEGSVVSDFSIVGPGWQSDVALLTIGSVPSDRGAKREVALLVRGAKRHEVQFTAVKLDPPWLKVTFGEPQDWSESVVRIPLSIEIPPGRPPAIFLGTDQGRFARIVLGVKDANDPRELVMRVKFVIDDSQAARD